MPRLSDSLVLNKYILSLFGSTDLEALSQHLKDSALEGYDENNISRFHHALVVHLFGNENLPKELLLQYDQNIYSHTQAISQKREEPIKWKYFQYLALLFTEIYLDKYFTDSEALRKELNKFKEEKNSSNGNDFAAIPDYELLQDQNDLNKLAYWNATGSGKTLLMHINILQYQHYLKKHNKARNLNRIIVLTPNEGLSKQHLKEFAQSGMEAELFDKSGGALFIGQKIEIIDIHKLEETSGDKTVAVESFEGNNLVLVDEGHRGASGDSWKDKRNRLCESGFSFEYSATFGQAVHALTGAKQKALLSEYGKATLFDYSYRYFYKDGYGKDYQILNLDEEWEEKGYVRLYLTASLLSFYEQLLVYRDNNQEIAPYLIDKPLAIFVGGKVTKSINATTASDIVEVLRFFEVFVKNETQSIDYIQRILDDTTGLNNEHGQSIFRNAFHVIRESRKPAGAVYKDVLKEIFNSDVAGAYLHLDNLKGQDGEIGLRIGNADYFGVINVGDDKGLLKICEEKKLSVSEKAFSSSLFHAINDKQSKVNILIGSKKFSEGWSSWRVSTMGLLNIGRGEGSEIIQLFGRGVRLKGYKFSLKRSTALDHSMRPESIPAVLPILETLNIFGLRADYMQQFKDYLEEEGLPAESDYEKISFDVLPTITNLSEKNLKYIKVQDGSNFKKEAHVDATLAEGVPPIVLNWYPKVQVLKSARTTNITEVVAIEEGKLEGTHLAFLNWTQIYFEIQKFKNERSWYNLNLSIDELKSILEQQNWYTLLIPSAELELNDYRKVRIWQELSTVLLKAYIERLYNYKKSAFYSERIEVATLDNSHPNFEQDYKLLVKRSETTLIDRIKALRNIVQRNEFSENFNIAADFDALYSNLHLYQPLISVTNGSYSEVVKIKPVALNKGEKQFVEDLKAHFEAENDFYANKQLYLLRNMSKRGIGFFEANNFFPDFILWLVANGRQYISFIDPKGLRQIQGFEDPKVKLHKTIRETIQPRLNDPDIILNSFIISNTPYGQLSYWKDQEDIEDFNSNHIFFQEEQSETYISSLLQASLAIEQQEEVQ
ncbi:DEAD/DEAH box helicase family protein [Pontibacter sp. HSC-14F20]|uniref:DEAD/DEAH box helicase family protein n=1 Tax=Pontibacter sp. HSC-14F20 TaxID=2864136 RepID=UPI001C72BE84|nr:DEAD/DEAH box helicase family protein [Pontibacter sp. HSC-14F20]MBX0332966.1 DEAD/DEAH box helicase family protein [Pontibacter sp. HSC-14F20]